MSKIQELLAQRQIPALRGKEEMLEILQREEYGYLPAFPEELNFQTENDIEENFCAGKATLNRVTISGKVNGKEFAFPIHTVLPTAEGTYPFFIYVGFHPQIPNRYLPVEEIIDNGFAVLYLYYEDVTSDDGDFGNGLAGVLTDGKEREETAPGKIAMWAWGIHRAMDYAETLEMLDLTKAIVGGHSRLGKTALLAAALDERFAYVHSNDSGCSGAAITRQKQGETADAIYRQFPYWFCPNYQKYGNREDEMPFEQHYLLAMIAPRHLYVSSAKEDLWADPDSEFLGCCAAGEAWEKMGLTGFVCEDRLPQSGDHFWNGNIGYHLRDGLHYQSREDWNGVIGYFRASETVQLDFSFHRVCEDRAV